MAIQRRHYGQLGGKLLSTLAAKNIYLASACGGGGTCAECSAKFQQVVARYCQPNNHTLTTNSKTTTGVVLSCSEERYEDPIPDEVFGVKEWECEVVSNDNVATFIKELVLKLPEENVKFRAGGYVQLEPLLTKPSITKILILPRNTTTIGTDLIWDASNQSRTNY